MTDWPDSRTLGEARAWLSREVTEGAHCPLCTQYAKVYKRPIESGMAHGLIQMYLSVGVNIPFHTDFMATARGPAKLRYWNLVEPVGHAEWVITDFGELFIRDKAVVQKYALIYDARFLGLDGPMVSIQDCLGNKFDRAELLRRPGQLDVLGVEE